MSELQEQAARATIRKDVVAESLVYRLRVLRENGALDSLKSWNLDSIDEDLARHAEAEVHEKTARTAWIEELWSALERTAS